MRFPRGVAVAWIAWAALGVFSIAWSVDPGYTLGELRAELLYGALAFGAFFAAASGSPASVAALVDRARRGSRGGHRGPALAGHPSVRDIAPRRRRRPRSLLHPSRAGHAHALRDRVAGSLGIRARSARPRRRYGPGGRGRLVHGQSHRLGRVRGADRRGRRSRGISCRPGRSRSSRPVRILMLWAGLAVAIAFAGSMMERSERFFHRATGIAATLEGDLRPRTGRSRGRNSRMRRGSVTGSAGRCSPRRSCR